MVQQLVAAGAVVDAGGGPNGGTLLIRASLKPCMGAIRALRVAGAAAGAALLCVTKLQMNKMNGQFAKRDWTAGPSVAELLAYEAVAAALLDNCVGGTASTGSATLFAAIKGGNTRIVTMLLRAGAAVNAEDKDGAAFVAAATQLGKAEMVTSLLQAAGAKCSTVNAAGEDPSTVLMHAAACNDAEIVALLLQAGAAVDAAADYAGLSGATALMNAAKHNHTEVGSVLLRAGAAVDNADSAGSTALVWAVKKGSIDMVRCLLKAGAAVNAVSEGGNTALHLAVAAPLISYQGSLFLREEQEAIVCELLKAGANVTAACNLGYTPLHLAAQLNAASVARHLLAAGAQLEATALHWEGECVRAACAGTIR
jgi:ankyrin repeat protein